jgi:hypothetical protein
MCAGHAGAPGSTVKAPFLPVYGLQPREKRAGIFSLQRNIEKVGIPLAEARSTCGNVAHFLFRPCCAWLRSAAPGKGAGPLQGEALFGSTDATEGGGSVQSDESKVAFPNDSRQLM